MNYSGLTQRILPAIAGIVAATAGAVADDAAPAGIPIKCRVRYLYETRASDQPQPVVQYAIGEITAAPRVAIDPNAEGFTLRGWTPSPDGRLIVYGRAASADANSAELRLRETNSSVDLALRIADVASGGAVWDKDGEGFMYVDRNSAVRRHRFGTMVEDDPVVAPAGRVGPNATNAALRPASERGAAFVIHSSRQDREHPAWALLLEGQPPADLRADAYIVGDADAFAGRLYALGAGSGRGGPALLASDVAAPQGAWQRLREPADEYASVQRFAIVGKQLVVQPTGQQALVALDLDGQDPRPIELPVSGTIVAFGGPPDDPELFTLIETADTGNVLVRCDLDAGTSAIVRAAKRDGQ